MAVRAINQTLAMIDSLIIDCLISDNHGHESEVSEYPVESGDTISDHIRNKPVTVEVECIVSNTPLRSSPQPVPSILRNGVSNALAAAAAGVPPADDAYAQLMRIREARKPVSIRTSIKTYENMALKMLSIPRTSATGDCLRFNATFVQIKIVKNMRGPRVAIPGGLKKKRVTKPPAPVTNKVSFNDSLPLVKVFRIDGDYIWFDDDIAGWRYGVIHDPPIGGKASDEGWVVNKGKPYGLTSDEWYAKKKPDGEYREDIGNAYDARSELNGGGAGLPLNKYDPFINFGVDERGQDFRIVHAIKR